MNTRFVPPGARKNGKKLCAGALMIAFLGASVTVHAQQDEKSVEEQGIEISVKGGAKRTLIPIAIAPAQGDSKSAKRVEELLRKDIELAGYFKLIGSDALFFDASKEGMSADKIKFSDWANINAQGLWPRVKAAQRYLDELGKAPERYRFKVRKNLRTRLHNRFE